MKKKLIVGAVVPVVASLGLWLGTGGAAVAHAGGAKAAANVAESTNGPDTDNIQSGDQTGPDTVTASAQTSTSGSGEQSGENQGEGSSSENGQSDGPGGHQDPPGNVNHECTGDCQE
ncbi:MAG: hypothetical protein M3O84_01880 [Actinomycetota bacterium]|nr:hypothetical protein [Actinomycetota bacterium]